MKTKIDTLMRDIQIHKEVEKELAKRSHFCTKVIKRLKQQVKEMEAEKAEGWRNQNDSNYGKPAVAGAKKSIQTNKQNEELINFLEHKLEEFENKLQRTQSEYELLQNEYGQL